MQPRLRPRRTLVWISLGVLAFLYLPIVLLIAFSFNASPMSIHWQGATLEWYRLLIADTSLLDAARNSLIVAVTSTVLSVVLGTAAAVALERPGVVGIRLLDLCLLLPLVVPEILMGVSLLLFFVLVEVPLGLATVTIGHLAFNLPLVILVVRARLRKLDPLLADAARDLGATPAQAFRWVTLPLLRPAVMGAALLAFTVSLDDFVVTFFTAGPGSTTLPLKVFSMIKTGITPEINALSALLVVLSMGGIALSIWLQRRAPAGSPVDSPVDS